MKTCILSILFAVLSLTAHARTGNVIDLSGKWAFRLDSLDEGERDNWHTGTFSEEIRLPGTTDLAQKGVKNKLAPALQKPQLSHLTRKYRYVGAAWYAKEVAIPANWMKKSVTLELERVIWKTNVWVNGHKLAKSEESLIAPHRYEISEHLRPGESNKIVIRIDNRKQYDITVDNMAHAYTDHTQIMWNGILGDITLTSHNDVNVSNLMAYPAKDNKSLVARTTVSNNRTKKKKHTFRLSLTDNETGQVMGALTEKRELPAGTSEQQFEFKNLTSIKEWNEFNPALYTLQVELESQPASVEFGFRSIERDSNRLKINGQPLFLRGTLDCCVFPLTGAPPTDREQWTTWLKTTKDWGINHIRFHSWCPPKAAFEAADRLGLYLQVELPLWSVSVGKDEQVVKFLKTEGERIFREYSNHPSFCFFSLGNELQSDFKVLGSLLQELRREDGRQLYTTTSFTFEGGHGDVPEAADDFFITQWTKKGWVRGQGVFNQQSPSFDKNFNTSIEGIKVPLITHEIGQYSVYPDMNEINKYTGVLEPINFKAIEADLRNKGLLHKAADYLKASGRLAAILYKEEIERALKTAGISGFQLLSLSDFPGQGTALVGLLNAFGESKGVTSAEEFGEACAPVTPLLMFPKAAYTNNEPFTATIDATNYSPEDLDSKQIEWSVSKSDNEKFLSGSIPGISIKQGYNRGLGTISFSLSDISEASRLIISVKIEGTTYKNRWSVWVYPPASKIALGQVKYTRNFKEAQRLLKAGEKVLFNPDWKNVKGIEGKFVPVFWSPVHFPKQAGTMGILCNPQHPALRDFPTDYHSDWQWWDLNTKSTTLIIDSLRGGQSIVDMIDNFTNNRRLSILFEGTVGKGKLIVTTIDLHSDPGNRPVARQMLRSLTRYMNSDGFNPPPIENIEIIGGMIDDQLSNQASDAGGIYN